MKKRYLRYMEYINKNIKTNIINGVSDHNYLRISRIGKSISLFLEGANKINKPILKTMETKNFKELAQTYIKDIKNLYEKSLENNSSSSNSFVYSYKKYYEPIIENLKEQLKTKENNKYR